MAREVAIARAVDADDADALHAALTDGGYLPEPDTFAPADLLAQISAMGAWYLEPGVRRFDPRYVSTLLDETSGPRAPWFNQMRRQTLPPQALLMRRMEGLVFSTLGEVRAAADWNAIAREYYADAAPSTPLGEAERAFWGAEPRAHHAVGLRRLVDQQVAAAELGGDGAERAAAGEGVEAEVAGARRGLHHPPHDPLRLLRRVAGLLPPGGGHDRVPPRVARPLAALALLGGDEAGRHVGLAVDGVGVEVVTAGGLDVDEDRVVLGGPARARLGAVVVGPDELVEEALAAEQLVEQQLAVVRLAVVDVEVQRAVGREQPADLCEARREEAEVVVERVAVGGLLEQARRVAAAAEARPVAVRVGGRSRACGGPGSARC